MKKPDLDKAFPKTPPYVHHCVLAAFEEGERRADRQKRRRAGFCALAAVLLIFVMGGIALKSRLEPTPDGRLTALSAQSDLSPSPAGSLGITPEPTPFADDSTASALNWNFIESAALYADGFDECLGQCDSSQCDLTYLIATTLTCQTELTSYVSSAFEAPLRLDLTGFATDNEDTLQSLSVRLNWNSGLNLFEMDGRYWALENGCDALFEALGIDEAALLDILSGRITYTVEESSESTPAPTQTVTATPVPQPTEENAASTPDAEEAFALEDIHNLTCAQLCIGESVVASLSDRQTLSQLENMLFGAVPLTECTCPFAPQLILTDKDGSHWCIEPSYDGCSTVRCDGVFYDLALNDSEELWELFNLSSDDVLEILVSESMDSNPFAFTLPGSSYYHISPECNALSVEIEAYLMLAQNTAVIDEHTGHISGIIISSRSACIEQGLTGCAYCALTVYAAPGDIFYHANAECAHSTNSMLLAEMEDPRAACPLCMSGSGGIYDSLGAELVLYTEESNLYHKNVLCSTALLELACVELPAETDSGLATLFPTEEEAIHKMGLTPCPYCAETVYATPKGQWYHADSACSGMMNAQPCTALEAESQGKPACPICLSDQATASSIAAATPGHTPTPEPENEAEIGFGTGISDD